MFTAAPRPSTAPLVRAWAQGAARSTPRIDSSLWTPPNRKGSVHWMARGAWALERIAAVRGGSAATVWLPADFCYGSTVALRAAGAKLVFYPVDRNARPDWTACRALAGTTAVDVFVLVHAFGVANDSRGARAFADGYGGLLVEDAAHVLRPTPGIGATGDAVFFSPHKWMAMPDGAILWVRDGITVPPIPKAKTPTGRWTLKRLIQDLMPDWSQPQPARQGPQGFLVDPPASDTPPAPGMSALAIGLLSAVTDVGLEEIGAARRANHAAWIEALSGLGGVRVAPSGDPPYRCVVMAETPDRAEALFDALRAVDVPAESWPDVPPAVAADGAQFDDALALRHHRVLLPVHQDVRPAHILSAGRALKLTL